MEPIKFFITFFIFFIVFWIGNFFGIKQEKSNLKNEYVKVEEIIKQEQKVLDDLKFQLKLQEQYYRVIVK